MPTTTLNPQTDEEIEAFQSAAFARQLALEKPPAERAAVKREDYINYLTTILGFDDCGHDVDGNRVTWEPVIVTRGEDCREELVEQLVRAIVALNGGTSSEHASVDAGGLNYSVSVVVRPRGIAK